MIFKKVFIFALALISAIIIFLMLNVLNKKQEIAKSLPTLQILVATKNLKPGDIISMKTFTWKDWPLSSVSTQYFKPNQKKDIEDLVGAVVRYPIFEGEPIARTNVIQTGGRSILAAIIRPGMRAVSVPFSRIVNAPSLILPGDVVDIVIPKREERKGYNEDIVGQTIIRGVQVLAVDNILQKATTDADTGSPRTLTLEVTAAQAEDLAASIPEGKIVISMRSVFSGQEKEGDTSKKESSADPQEGTPGHTVSIIRGGERSEVTFK